DGIDLFVDNPYSEKAKEATNLIKEFGFGVGLVMPAALAGQGLYLGDKSKDIRDVCIKKIGEIIEYTSEIDGMVSLGLVRGSQSPEETLEEFNQRFIDSCEKLLNISEKYNMDLVLEPINRYEINTINSMQEGLDFLKETKLPISLLADTFHMNIEDVNLERILIESMSYIKHIHFLDSNRLAPSMGHMNMEALYKVIKDHNYKGFLCLEALAKPNSVEVAEKGAEFFRKCEQKFK
ncbi:hypothetical protein AN640_05945, partial [Candidatus Epulonipiscium fishelsonii]